MGLKHGPASEGRSLPGRERLVIYCQTTGVSAAHATHCATYCTPCRPLIRAFSGWIRTPPPTWYRQTPPLEGWAHVRECWIHPVRVFVTPREYSARPGGAEHSPGRVSGARVTWHARQHLRPHGKRVETQNFRTMEFTARMIYHHS